MPKRTQEYRDARREQILSAAKRCFVRNGFHETSMQDLFAEAELSAGAVYRYFASKDEVILAIAQENMSEVMTLIADLAADPKRDGIAATLSSVLDLLRKKSAEDELGPIALLVWAEALRNPTIRSGFEASLAEMRAAFTGVVRRHAKVRRLPRGVTADAMAALLLATVPGFILQLTLLGEDSLASVDRALRAVWPD